MLDAHQIEDWLRADLAREKLEKLVVSGDGRHFQALIVSAEFVGLSRVARQQRVNAVLGKHFDAGVLHALSMQCLTPDEARARGLFG